MDNDELALATMDDDGYGWAITSEPARGITGQFAACRGHKFPRAEQEQYAGQSWEASNPGWPGQPQSAELPDMNETSGPEGFYVSVMDHGRSGMLLGPYATRADAEHDVDTGRKLAKQVNDRAIWYAYGVTRVVMQPGAALPKGKLNEIARQALACGH